MYRRRRRDATKQFRRVGVGGVYWALHVRLMHRVYFDSFSLDGDILISH